MRRLHIFLVSLFLYASAHSMEVPISGSYFRIAADRSGNVFAVTHEDRNIVIVDLVNMKRYPAGVSTYRDYLFSGISAGCGMVVITYTPDNMSIRAKTFSLASKTWGPEEIVYRDTVPGPDTNRSSVAISDNGDIMVVAQADGRILSFRKQSSQNWEGACEMSPYDDSEPTSPMIVADGNEFWASCTVTRPGVPGTAGKTIAIYHWVNGSWVEIKKLDEEWVPGSPDGNALYVNPGSSVGGMYYDWCSEESEYCTINYYEWKDGVWRHDVLLEGPNIGNLDHLPNLSVASDSSGNIVACCFYWNMGSKQTFVRCRKAGQVWGAKEHKGSGGMIAVTYNPREKMFYLLYYAGVIVLEKFSFEIVSPTPTPTPTPKPGYIEAYVPVYDIFEKVVGEGEFGGMTVCGTFTHTSGISRTVRGFYDGYGRWIVRFRPDLGGDYVYETRSTPDMPIFRKCGKISGVDPRPGQHGPIFRDGPFLRHADGTDHIHNGGTSFGLIGDFSGPTSSGSSNTIQFLRHYLTRGINYYRIGLNITWGRGGTPGSFSGCEGGGYVNGCWVNSFMWGFQPYPPQNSPDWSSMNYERFGKLDAAVKFLLENNAFAEIVLFDSSMKYAFGPREMGRGNLYLDTPKQEAFISYLTARFGEFPNIVYEIGNEIQHNTADPQVEWVQAKEWVRWVGQTLKAYSPLQPVAYDASWDTLTWDYGPSDDNPNTPATFKCNEANYPDCERLWHAPLWGEDWCDIVNIHTDRSCSYWWKGPAQLWALRESYGKPVSSDEPHRRGYGSTSGCVDDTGLRRATWLAAFNSSSYTTQHGVSGGDFCRGCIEDGDVFPQAEHFLRFWSEFGYYGLYPDWNLIEGVCATNIKRSSHRDGKYYAYYAIEPLGDFTLKTLEDGNWSLFIMNCETGESSGTKFRGNKIAVQVGGMKEFAAFIKPYVSPSPTPTQTPTPTPVSGSHPPSCYGIIAVDNDRTIDNSGFLASLLLGIVLIIPASATFEKRNGKGRKSP